MSNLAIVTGAAGFIGSHCALELHKKGYAVIGLDTNSPFTIKDTGISYFHQSSVNEGSLESICNAYGVPTCLIHCAGLGSVSVSLENPGADFKANVLSALEVLEFSRRHQHCVRIVFPSSAAVYGNISTTPLAENMPGQPVSPYGVHKKIMETLALSYGSNFGIASACVRLFSVYGEGLRKQLLWDACQKAYGGIFSFWGSGREQRDWLHVRDAAKLMCIAIEHTSPSSPVVNGGTGHGTSTADILKLLGNQWDPPKIPAFSGQDRKGDPVYLVADVSRMREWEFKPEITLHEGIKAYAEWFKAEINYD